MKRNANLFLAAAAVVLMLVPLGLAQGNDDLAAYAREQKKEKQNAPAPAKVFDDDNLPKAGQINVVGSESAPASTDSPAGNASSDNASQTSSADQSKPADENKPAAIEPGQSAEDRQQAYRDWQAKIKDQKQAVDLAQRELDVQQREYHLRLAVVSNDVGYRLRNSAQWDKEDKQYKEQIAAKQKALDEARQKLTSLQEDARKAGVPTKALE